MSALSCAFCFSASDVFKRPASHRKNSAIFAMAPGIWRMSFSHDMAEENY
jgi:hypothetical protein